MNHMLHDSKGNYSPAPDDDFDIILYDDDEDPDYYRDGYSDD